MKGTTLIIIAILDIALILVIGLGNYGTPAYNNITPVAPPVPPPQNTTAWYDLQYNNRIPINYTGNNVSDYQVFVNITRLTDMNFTNMLAVDGDNLQRIGFWIEPDNNHTTYADIWFNANTTDLTNVTWAYFYYNFTNGTAPVYMNINETMQFGDTFDNAIDSSKWTVNTGSPTVTTYLGRSVLYVDQNGQQVTANSAYPAPSIYEVQFAQDINGGSGNARMKTITTTGDSEGTNGIGWINTNSGSNLNGISTASSSNTVTGLKTVSANVYHKTKLNYTTSLIDYFMDGVDVGSITTNIPTVATKFSVSSFTNNNELWAVDYMFVRKWDADEPIGSVGASQYLPDFLA